jgi:hypothetical protein
VPGFDANESAKHQPIWKVLEEWLACRTGLDPWEQAKGDWLRFPSYSLATFEQWKFQIAATRTLTQGGTGKARAVAVMENVDREANGHCGLLSVMLRGLALSGSPPVSG